MLKKNYFKFLFFFGLYTSLLYLNVKVFPKENPFSGKQTLHNAVLSQIENLSDQEIYKIAKQTNLDSIPGKTNYSQILLTEALRKNPKNVDALIEMAHTIELQQDEPIVKVQKKFSLLYQAFLIAPDNPKVRYKFASVLLELGQKELFQKIYTQTMQVFPNHQDTLIEKIQIFSKTNPQKAIEIANTALKNGANIEDFFEDFLSALQNSESGKNFQKNLLSYTTEYNNRWLWYQLGLEYVRNAEYLNAENAFKHSVALGNDIIGRLQLGILQYRQLNKIEQGIKNLQQVIHQIKDDPFVSKNLVYLAHIQLTCALMVSKNTQATRKELNFVAKYAFQNHASFIELMNEFIKHGEENLLPESIAIATQNDPLFAEPYVILSTIFKNQKKDELAKAAYQKFLVINSQKK